MAVVGYTVQRVSGDLLRIVWSGMSAVTGDTGTPVKLPIGAGKCLVQFGSTGATATNSPVQLMGTNNSVAGTRDSGMDDTAPAFTGAADGNWRICDDLNDSPVNININSAVGAGQGPSTIPETIHAPLWVAPSCTTTVSGATGVYCIVLVSGLRGVAGVA